ncbi:MAG TPA: hypothetical protein VI454_13285, partial [Verrucomicrobiae bacterium]
LNRAGTYRVKLVAADTGFDNTFSPQFEIKLTSDLVPRIELVEPQKDLLVPADEQLPLVGRAEDDLGLAAITQSTRVNAGLWIDTTLATPSNRVAVVTQQWDLATLKLKPGDQVTTKLVATDLKGNRSESLPAKLTIAAAGIDLRRLQAVESRKRLQDSVAELAKAVTQLDRAAGEANGRPAKGELRAAQARLGLLPQFEEAERLADAALAKLKAALSKVRSGREASDLAVAGVALAQLRHDLLGAVQADLRAVDLASTNVPLSGKDWFAATQPLRRAAELARSVEARLGDLLAAEHADVGYESVAYLVAEQSRLARRGAVLRADDKAGWTDYARRMESSTREAKSLEEQLQTWSARQPVSLANRTKKAALSLGRSRTILERGLAAIKDPRDAVKLAAPFQNDLNNGAVELTAARIESARAADRARDALYQAGAGALDALNRLTASATPPTKSRKPSLATDAQLRQTWSAAVAQLKTRVELEESRTDADSQFVADLAHAADALAALQSAHGSLDDLKSAATALGELETSLRLLETSRRFRETSAALRDMANQERWELSSPLAGTARPRDWQWLKGRWTAMPRETRNPPLAPDVEARLREVTTNAPSAEVTREMDARSNRRTRAISVAPQLDQLMAMLDEIARSLNSNLNSARDAITQAAPKLSERMEGLARKAEALEHETAEHKQRAEKMEAPAAREKTSALLTKQQELVGQIDEVRTILRREANAADLMDAEARESARDADDADAMLRDPPRKAADSLRDATAEDPGLSPAENLANANAEQAKTTQSLKQLAEHYRNSESGKSALSRSRLRQAEEQLGMKSLLDNRYSQAAALAELAKLSPQEQMTKLEEALKNSPPMQQELSSIMREALDSAGAALAQAAGDEKTLADRLHDSGNRQAAQAADAAAQMKRLQQDAQKLAQQKIPEA